MVVESGERKAERGEMTASSGRSLVIGGLSENRTLGERVQSVQGFSKPTPRGLVGRVRKQIRHNPSACLPHHLLSTYCIPGPSHVLRENMEPKITSIFF